MHRTNRDRIYHGLELGLIRGNGATRAALWFTICHRSYIKLYVICGTEVYFLNRREEQ
jgi:hypothetical protein